MNPGEKSPENQSRKPPPFEGGMNPVLTAERAVLFEGNALNVGEFGSNSVDAVLTDPPYELGFMGKRWDASGIAFSVFLWRAVLEVMKPGAFLLAFGGTRTSHRMVCAIEDAGFEIRDSIEWLYGTGFPKSLNLGEGRGTALKPAHEPICLAMKPLEGTFAANLAAHGTGALNIDETRIAISDKGGRWGDGRRAGGFVDTGAGKGDGVPNGKRHAAGRWPANVILDEDTAAKLDAQTAHLKSGGKIGKDTAAAAAARGAVVAMRPHDAPRGEWVPHGDSGGASRFFYVAKPGRKERDAGCDALPVRTGGEMTERTEGSDGLNSPRAGAGRTGGARNFHPTVKPVELLRYLVKLITPPGGLVLDPFAGSGSTGVAALAEGREFLGVELTPEYAAIAKARLEHALNPESRLT